MRKPQRLDHVKYVRAKGKLYAYFNTGEMRDGKPIYAPLPSPSSPAFFVRYGALKAARERRGSGYTIADACAGFEASSAYTGKAENTRKLYGHALRRIVKTLGRFPVSDLTRPDLQLVLDNEMAGPGSHNIFLAVLGLVYRHARREGKTTLKPTEDFEKARTGEHAAWPEPVLEAGLQSPHARTRLAIHLLYFTGQRISDVMKMRWSDIRGDRVHVIQQKTGKRLWIPLASELRDELAATPKRGLTIVTNEDGGPMTDQVIRREIKAHGASMGFEVVPHGLRKNAVIGLLHAGCTIAEVASITGQTFQIVEKYARQVDQEKLGEAAILKLENKRATGKRIGKSADKPSNINGVR
jgi:integrase